MGSPARTTSTFTREQVVGALDRLQADGRWSPYHAAALLQELDRASSTPPAPATPPRATHPPSPATSPPPPIGNRLAEAAGYVGAVLVGAAGAVLAGEHWDELGRT